MVSPNHNFYKWLFSDKCLGWVGKKLLCHYFMWLIIYLNINYLSPMIYYLFPLYTVLPLLLKTVCLSPVYNVPPQSILSVPFIYCLSPHIYCLLYTVCPPLLYTVCLPLIYWCLTQKKMPLFVTITAGWVGHE